MQGVGLIVFVLWIALSNLAVGFALAVFAGHGPRRLPSLFAKLPNLRLPTLRIPSLRQGTTENVVTDDDSSPSEPEPAPPSPVPETQTESTNVVDDGLPLDEALALFQQDVAEVRDGLNSVSDRLDACSAAPSVEAVEDCVADLKDAGQDMLQRQADQLKVVKESGGSAASSAVVTKVEQAAAEQASQIQQALNEIDQMEIRPETLQEDCQRLKDHTSALTASCDALGQSVNTAQAKVNIGDADVESNPSTSQCENQLEQVEASDALNNWWADDPDHQRPLTMVMIDLDRVGQLNECVGEETVDGLLARVQEEILAADILGGKASGINAQRFLLLLPDVDVPKLTHEIEALRERIHTIPDAQDNADVELTASCAIAISQPGDSARALVSRAEAALIEAKQFGGNRTFLNEGEFPTPVVGALAVEPASVN